MRSILFCFLVLVAGCSKEKERLIGLVPTFDDGFFIRPPEAPRRDMVRETQPPSPDYGAPTPPRLSSLPFGFLNAGTLILSDDRNGMSGTGRIIFSPLPSIRSDHAFTATIDVSADGKRVTLLANGKEDLSEAIAVTFTNDRSELRVGFACGDGRSFRLQSTGVRFPDNFPNLRSLQVGRPFRVKIDIHNSHGDFAIQTESNQLLAGISRTDVPNCRGSGEHWGFDLQDATVSAVAIATSQHRHTGGWGR